MKSVRIDEKHTDLIAFKCGAGSLVLGFLFCGLVLAIKDFLIFSLGGILVLIVCVTLVLLGFAVLIVHARRNPTSLRQRWLPWVSWVILILNFPLGVMCVKYTFTHFSFYTIAIVNDSRRPLDSVSLRSEYGGSTNTLALIPPEHRFATIEAGKRVKLTWDARDEDGVRLRFTWAGKITDFNVTGYTLWEEPNDFKVRIGQTGKVTVNGIESNKL